MTDWITDSHSEVITSGALWGLNFSQGLMHYLDKGISATFNGQAFSLCKVWIFFFSYTGVKAMRSKTLLCRNLQNRTSAPSSDPEEMTAAEAASRHTPFSVLKTKQNKTLAYTHDQGKGAKSSAALVLSLSKLFLGRPNCKS